VYSSIAIAFDVAFDVGIGVNDILIINIIENSKAIH
jgi:hypothetical protein